MINAISAPPVAAVLASRASAVFPFARRSAMIPDPTTAASRKNVPSASATTRFFNGRHIRDSNRCWRTARGRALGGQHFGVARGLVQLCSTLTRCSFRQVVLEHDEHFPIVAVRIAYPGFVLQCVATVGLHFISCQQSGLFPFLPHRQYVCGLLNLNSEM